MSESALQDSILGELSGDVRERLLAISTRRKLDAGETLLRQGEANATLFIVASGSLHVSRDGAGGAVTVATLGPSEIVGDMSLLRKTPVSANVVAAEPTEVLALERDVLARHPDLEAHVRAVLGLVGLERLDRTTQDLQRRHERELQALDLQMSATRFIVSNIVALACYMLSMPLSQYLATILPLDTTLVSLIFIVTFFLLAVNFLRREGGRFKQYGITLENWRRQVKIGVIAALPIMAATLAGKYFYRRAVQGEFDLLDLSRHLTDGKILIGAIVALSIGYMIFAFAQEIVRCTIQKAIEIYYAAGHEDAPVRTVLVTAIIFAGTHAHIGIKFASLAGLIGIYWGIVYRLSGSYIAVAVNHALIGCFAVFIVGPA